MGELTPGPDRKMSLRGLNLSSPDQARLLKKYETRCDALRGYAFSCLSMTGLSADFCWTLYRVPPQNASKGQAGITREILLIADRGTDRLGYTVRAISNERFFANGNTLVLAQDWGLSPDNDAQINVGSFEMKDGKAITDNVPYFYVNNEGNLRLEEYGEMPPTGEEIWNYEAGKNGHGYMSVTPLGDPDNMFDRIDALATGKAMLEEIHAVNAQPQFWGRWQYSNP